MSKVKWFGASTLALLAALKHEAAHAGPVAPLVKNSSFEADVTGVASPKSWSSSGSSQADFSEGGGHSGNLKQRPGRRLRYSARDFFCRHRLAGPIVSRALIQLRGMAQILRNETGTIVAQSCSSRPRGSQVSANPEMVLWGTSTFR